jgi:hypothetical protein
MSINDISNNILIDKIHKINKPKLIRRNAIANLELTESYKEFFKSYKEFFKTYKEDIAK